MTLQLRHATTNRTPQRPQDPQAVYDIHSGPVVFLTFSEMLFSGRQELKLININVQGNSSSSNIQFTI